MVFLVEQRSNSPCSNFAGQTWQAVGHEGNHVCSEQLIPLSPDAPVGEPPDTPSWQQGVISWPGNDLEALQQAILSNLFC